MDLELEYNNYLKNNSFNNSIADISFIISFTVNSCGIEGNTFSVEECKKVFKNGLINLPKNRTLIEAKEILNHINALQFLIQERDQLISEGLVKKTHSILMKDIYDFQDEKLGEYTKVQMTAGDTIFGNPIENIKVMPKLIEATNLAIKKNNLHPIKISARFHKYFIYLHPFRDGNGRLARLLSNFILFKLETLPIIIYKESKNNYINSLKASHKHKSNEPIECFFYKTAIKNLIIQLNKS